MINKPFLSLQVKIFLDFLKCFASMLQSYAIPTLVVTYFVFILTYSYTVLDQYGKESLVYSESDK